MTVDGIEKTRITAGERRADKRLINVLQFATVQDEHGCHPCLVINIGVGGMQIRLHHFVDLAGALTFELRGDFRIIGKLAWQRETTAGIQFLEELDWSAMLAVSAPSGPRSRAPRLPLQMRVMARCGASLIPVLVRNITPAGARLQVEGDRLGERNMTLNIPGVGQRGAQIRWHIDREVGVLFHQPLLGNELAALLDVTS